jgi:HlyD family secretion protein
MTTPDRPTPTPIRAVPAAAVPSRRRALQALGVALLAAAGIAGWRLRPGAAGPTADAQAARERLMLQAVTRGPLERRISVSGTLNPVNQVQVGTQVSGTVRALHVDYNDTVRPGQLLAELDTTTLDAELRSAEAGLRGAQAAVALAQAELARDRGLLAQGFIAEAEVAQRDADLAAAVSTRQQQQAALDRARHNRAHAEIRSPVAGTVVSREVAVGQTVQASFSTPVLFKIAEDLSAMQIDASVAEADVGQVQAGQAVQFTVDAFPDDLFDGTVHQVRNNYTVQQNVVTYTVVVRARNPDRRLRPGMTAYLAVTVGRRAQTLRVPNAALRFDPGEALRQALAVPGAAAAVAAAGPMQASRRSVWRLRADGRIEPVTLRLGLADAQWTEVVDGPLAPGDRLAVGEAVPGVPMGPKLF